MGRSPILIFLLACTICAALAQPAIGQEVHTDPDSPSGTEYQIPVERARETGSRDGRNPKKAGERSAPLFGEGIDQTSDDATSEDDTDDSNTAVVPAGGDDDGGGGNGHGGAPAKARATPVETADPAPTAATADDDSDGLPLALGLGALVLAMGAGLGYVLRRRSGRPVDHSA